MEESLRGELKDFTNRAKGHLSLLVHIKTHHPSYCHLTVTLPLCRPQGPSGGFAGQPEYNDLDTCLLAEETLWETSLWIHPTTLYQELSATEPRVCEYNYHEGVTGRGNVWNGMLGMGVQGCMFF